MFREKQNKFTKQGERVPPRSGIKITKIKPDVPPYDLIRVDMFTKYIHGAPMYFRDGDSWRQASESTVKLMGLPDMIYSDSDTSILPHEVKTFCQATD